MHPITVSMGNFECSSNGVRFYTLYTHVVLCVVIFRSLYIDSYLKAFFGKSEAWQNAFRRFLETPPKSVNDRIVLREVMELLRTGVRYMCPRGLMILADATEVRSLQPCYFVFYSFLPPFTPAPAPPIYFPLVSFFYPRLVLFVLLMWLRCSAVSDRFHCFQCFRQS